MVSLATERWPDTVLPSVTHIISSPIMVLNIAPKHVFDAWEQISLELAKLPCQVVCQFGTTPLQKTLLYGSRVMPLRIFENVHKCDIRGFIKNGDTLDIICTDSDTFNGNHTGWRVTAAQIVCLEIRTKKGTIALRTTGDTSQRWLSTSMADELSCWLWSVSPKRRRANCHSILEDLENAGLLTDNMLNILK